MSKSRQALLRSQPVAQHVKLCPLRRQLGRLHLHPDSIPAFRIALQGFHGPVQRAQRLHHLLSPRPYQRLGVTQSGLVQGATPVGGPATEEVQHHVQVFIVLAPQQLPRGTRPGIGANDVAPGVVMSHGAREYAAA